MRQSLTLLVLLIGALGAIFLTTEFSYPKEPPRTDGKYNVILISIDSLRRDHMGVYGYERNTTPAIDAWAKGAVVFENYIATSFLTPISEMSVHTGQHPFTNGVSHFSASLQDESETIAQILKRNGWQTATFSSSPEFTIFKELAPGFTRGYDYIESASATTTSERWRERNAPRQAVAWLKETRDTNSPFFVWISLGGVHWPYGKNAPYRFTSRAYDGFMKDIPNAVWSTYGYLYDGKRYDPETKEVIGTVSEEDISFVRDRYDDGILHTDTMLRELFYYLKQSGLEESTIVIVHSEHGESLGERGYVAHYNIFDEEVRVPLIIKDPSFPSLRTSSIISGVDILPTVLELLSLEQPSTDGVSFVPHLQGEESAPRSDVFITRTPLWEKIIHAPEGYEGNPYDTAIRSTSWKLIHRLSRQFQYEHGWWGVLTGTPTIVPEYELYDLTSDPGEKNNVFDEYAQHPEVMRLQEKLFEFERKIQSHAASIKLPPLIQPYF